MGGCLQVRSVVGIVHDLEAHETPQVLVLNKADAVAANPVAARLARETDWGGLYGALPPPAHVVATSAIDGRGLEKLRAAVEEALLSTCTRVDCVLPYAASAVLAEVHKAGTISLEEYVTDGTHLVAHVPTSLRNRIEKTCQSEGLAFDAEAPQPSRLERPESAKRNAKGRLS